MSRPRTVNDLLFEIGQLADVQGAVLRHNPLGVTAELNQAIQRFREWVTDEGYALYLAPYTVALTVGATAPFVWGTVDLSAVAPPFARAKFVEITIDGVRYDLDRVPFESRNEYSQTKGVPVAWIQYGNTIGILPPPQSPYSITVWGLPVFADLLNPTDTFDGIAGWEEWVRWTVLHALLTRDQYPAQYANALAQADRIKQDIKAKIRGDRPSVLRRRDVSAQRMGLHRRGRWP